MKVRHPMGNSKILRNLRHGEIMIKEKPKHLNRIVSQILLWLQLTKLLLKIVQLGFKVFVLRFERRNLLSKQRDLLLKKSDYFSAQAGCNGNLGDFLGGIDGAHSDGDSSKPITSSKSQT